jgi:hypothetical protein
MSKIITKKQLNILIESTLEEVGNMVENVNEVKVTQEHIDQLKDVGHCMCGDKCLVYPEAAYGDSRKSYEVVKLVAEKDGDCVVMEKKHMDMLERDGKCTCGDVTLTMETEMDESEVLMDDNTNEEDMCVECGSGMTEEDDVEEGNKFAGELAKAREKGENTFTLDGKEYKVEAVSESLKEKNNLLKEELNKFNKIINYKN